MWFKDCDSGGASRLYLPLLTVVALGFFLRVYQSGSEGLWVDEAFSIWLGKQPLVEMLRWVVRIDQHPPLYYILLHVWMRFLGDGVAVVRMLSAFIGTLTIPVLYLLGRRLVDEKVGLLSALILALSPFHVHFAQEARMYTLLTLNASLALLAVSGCMGSNSRLSSAGTSDLRLDTSLLGVIVSTAATLWTHNTAIFLLSAVNLAVLGLHLIRSHSTQYAAGPTVHVSYVMHKWLLAQTVVFALWLPWLPGLVTQSVGVYREFWLSAPTWETVVGAVAALLIDFLPLPLVGVCGVTVALAALALVGLCRLRRRPEHALLLGSVFVTPFIGEWLVSLWRPIFYTRTLIWASLPLYLLMAAGTCRLRRWPCLLIAVLILLLAANGLALQEYHVGFEKEGWDDAAALVAERVESEDLILFNATWGQLPFDYYFHRLYNQPVAEHGAPVDLFDRGVLEPKMTEGDLPRLKALLAGYDRVWLIYSHDWYTDPQGLISSTLEQEHDLLGRWEFHGVRVWECRRE